MQWLEVAMTERQIVHDISDLSCFTRHSRQGKSHQSVHQSKIATENLRNNISLYCGYVNVTFRIETCFLVFPPSHLESTTAYRVRPGEPCQVCLSSVEVLLYKVLKFGRRVHH